MSVFKNGLKLGVVGVVVFSVIVLSGYKTDDLEIDTPRFKSLVSKQYADLAHATYEDSLLLANQLAVAIGQLASTPSNQTLENARQAWIQARVPYQQSEVFRFGNEVVDDWEGGVNAWPLDEGLIDYVDSEEYEYVMGNFGGKANIIANTSITNGKTQIDVSEITPELISSLNEFGGSESNVASGYHAIEFLLWGQDLNGTGEGAGNRLASDFVTGEGCTNGNCERRVDYLKAAIELLQKDLRFMTKEWAPEGAYRRQLLTEAPEKVFRRMLFGMGSLSLGELAGERMKVALEANSPEDEHDCFSDNTHNSHYYNAKGVSNVYLGRYQRVDGSIVSGPSLSDLVARLDVELDTKMKAALHSTMDALTVLVEKAESENEPMTFDMMIAEGNTEGRETIERAINQLVAQTKEIESVAVALGIEQLQPETASHTF